MFGPDSYQYVFPTGEKDKNILRYSFLKSDLSRDFIFSFGKKIHEIVFAMRDKQWSQAEVEKAIRALLNEKSSLFVTLPPEDQEGYLELSLHVFENIAAGSDEEHLLANFVPDWVRIEEKQGEIQMENPIRDMRWLMKRCFAEEEETWQADVAMMIEDVLGVMADFLLHGKKSTDWCKFAQISGSLARVPFGESPCRKQAARVIAEAHRNLSSHLSPYIVASLERSIYDLDIKIPTDFDFAGLATALKLAIEKLKLPAEISHLHIKEVHVIVVTLRLPNGQNFSIDITRVPQSEEEYQEDFRLGAHLSHKREASFDLVAFCQDDYTQVGFTIDPFQAIITQFDMSCPSLIKNPRYGDFVQAIYSALSLIRLEFFSSADWIFGEQRIHHRTEAALFVQQLIVLLYKNKILVVEDYRREEIIREGLVVLCADKDEAIRLMREIGIDRILGIEAELELLEEMSLTEFREKISNDATFLEFCATLFDVRQLNQPRAKCASRHDWLPSVGDPNASQAGSLMEDMSRKAALATLSWENFVLTRDELLSWGTYVTWTLVPGRPVPSDGLAVIHDQVFLAGCASAFPPDAEVFLLPGNYFDGPARLAKIKPGIDKGGLYSTLVDKRLWQYASAAYSSFFLAEGFGFESLGAIRSRREQGIFHDFYLSKLPLMICRVYMLQDGIFATLTHPVGVNPDMVRFYLERTINHHDRPLSEVSLLKQQTDIAIREIMGI